MFSLTVLALEARVYFYFLLVKHDLAYGRNKYLKTRTYADKILKQFNQNCKRSKFRWVSDDQLQSFIKSMAKERFN